MVFIGLPVNSELANKIEISVREKGTAKVGSACAGLGSGGVKCAR